jgi:hypothetical protein
MSEDQEQENELGNILPLEEPTHAPAEQPLRVFQPWHLPRKQHVRKSQWAHYLNELLDAMPDRALIKYLGLPGEDLLDLQVLADICRAKARRLKYLGFDQSLASKRPSTQRLAAEQIVLQMDIVENTSQVLPDDFTSIARDDSIGNSHLRDGGSYDVVNLDMCDAFTTHEWAPTHDAIRALLMHQTNHRAEPWLMFITTRSEVGRLQQSEITAYANAIQQNAAQSPSFLQSLAQVADIQDAMDAATLTTHIRGRLGNDTFLSGRWLSLGIGKWLLGIMALPEPWRVDLLSVYSYRTGLLSEDGNVYAGEPPNLFSLAFRFEKIQQVRRDPAELAVGETPEFAPLNEVALAEKLARCVQNHTHDVDRIMEANPAAAQALLDECASLLEVRYYSPEAYREWLARLPRIQN